MKIKIQGLLKVEGLRGDSPPSPHIKLRPQWIQPQGKFATQSTRLPTQIYIILCYPVLRQSCLCDPIDHSPLCPSVHGILPAKMLRWTVISLSMESFLSRNKICISCISCTGILYHCAPWEALHHLRDPQSSRHESNQIPERLGVEHKH